MILPIFLLPSLLQLLAFSAIADGYPLHPRNDVIRRSSRDPRCVSLPQLQWRRCMLREGDNCRGLDMEDSQATNTINFIPQRPEQGSAQDYSCDDDDDFDTDATTSYPTTTIHPRRGETGTPIPTTELMQGRKRTFYVEDDLDDDDQDISAIPTPPTLTTRSHGTFLPPRTSSACSLQPEPKTLGTCRRSFWVAFFDTSSNDPGRYVTPGPVALSLVVLFILAVLVVEVSEGLWRLWNSMPSVGQRIRLTGPEKKLLAPSDEDSSPGDEHLEYHDYSSDYGREKQDVDES